MKLNNPLSVAAFEEPINVKGKTYYCSSARMFNILRLPAVLGHLFPQLKRQKISYEIKCFPDLKSFKQVVEGLEEAPLILSFKKREE